jgi:hypothetical protein
MRRFVFHRQCSTTICHLEAVVETAVAADINDATHDNEWRQIITIGDILSDMVLCKDTLKKRSLDGFSTIHCRHCLTDLIFHRHHFRMDDSPMDPMLSKRLKPILDPARLTSSYNNLPLTWLLPPMNYSLDW